MVTVGLGVLIALVVFGAPIYLAAFGGVILIVMFVMHIDPMVIAMVSFDKVDQFVLLAVPFFLLAGQFIALGGAGKPLVEFLSSIMGHIPGGPAYTLIVACTIFAAMSSSSMAAIAAFGPVILPMMLQLGYSKEFSIGLLLAGGALGPLIPPSIPLILYGVIAEQSVRTLYTAAFIPGVMIASFLAVTVFLWSRKGHYKRLPAAPWGVRWQKLKAAWPVLGMPVAVLVPIYAGLVTPTESAAVAAVYSLLLGTVVYRHLKLPQIWESLRQTVLVCGMVFFIIMGAFLLNLVLTYIRLPFELSEMLINAHFSAAVFLLVIIIVYIMMGMFLDPSAILLVSVPILLPAVTDMGVSPVIYGIMVAIAVEFAGITPPYGMTLFAAVGILREPFEVVTRGVIMFFPANVLGMILITYVPQISLFLPRLLGLQV